MIKYSKTIITKKLIISTLIISANFVMIIICFITICNKLFLVLTYCIYKLKILKKFSKDFVFN